MNNGAYKNVNLTKSITTYDTPREYKGQQIVAVLGPIDCWLCEGECPDAYIALNQDQLDVFQQHDDFSSMRSDTPVYIRHLEEKKPESGETVTILTDATPNKTLSSEPERVSPRVSSIINDLIDITRGNILSVSRNGTVNVHSAFQPELEFQPTPEVLLPNTSFELDQDDQYRLF